MTQALLEGQRLIVTGGGRGIGEAAARLFVEEGARVVVASRTAAEVERVVISINAHHGAGSAHPVVTDVTQEGSVAELVARAQTLLGGIDGVFACAGVGVSTASVIDLDVETFQGAFNANTLSSWLTVRHVARALIAQGTGGSIVTTSSIASVVPQTQAGIYAAAKSAVDRLSRLAAHELGPHQIRVNTIAPGATRTAMLDAWEKKAPGTIQQVSRAAPLGRMAEPREVAEAAAWLLSKRASYVSGVFLLVDGARFA